MSNLQYFLNAIDEIHKGEATLFKLSLKFFVDINAKITKAYKEHNIQSVYEINVLDYNGLGETQTSNLIKHIFAYEHNGNYPIWKSFVEKFYSKELAKSIKHPVFKLEEQHIDICVKERKKYVFIFENKLKGAVFQRNQLGRYIMTVQLEKYKLENIYLVIMPGYIDDNFIENVRKSVWKVPADWKEANEKRKCIALKSADSHACRCDDKKWIDDDWCEKCKDYKPWLESLENHVKVIDREFPQWLVETANDESCISQKEYLLRSAMIQFAHYIKGLYQIRLNIKEIMENIKILANELKLDPENPEESYVKVTKKLNDLIELQQSMKMLKSILQIRVWQKEIEEHFPKARVDM